MNTRLWTACRVAAVCCILLSGCATRGPLLESSAGQVELTDTPFFPQDRYQCGPAALATVLQASGVAVTPQELLEQVYVPARRGSLTVEMEAAPRRYDRLSYPLRPDLAAIIAELDAGRPVLVLHNYGLPFWPRWHYAVVIGYDAQRQRVLLRSGTEHRQQMRLTHFMRAWDNGRRWALVLLRPGELPATVERTRYLQSASSLERPASTSAVMQAFDAAVTRWPTEPLAWVGRGTARYRSGALREAAADYRHALQLDPSLAGARNNLAMTMLELGCPKLARREVEQIDAAGLAVNMRDAVADTRRQIEAQALEVDKESCSSLR